MEYFFHLFILFGIYGILSISLNFIIGFTGIPSLGHIAFYCIGAYTSSLIVLHTTISPWVALFISAFFTSIIALIISYSTLKLDGDMLAIATFGYSIIIYSLSKNWISLTRGPMGLTNIPSIYIIKTNMLYVYNYSIITLIFLIVTILFYTQLSKSPYGRILIAIREDELLSSLIGKNTFKFKISIFTIGAFFAGISGALYAHYMNFIDPSSFTITETITVLLMIILGGLASIKGSISGSLILIIFPEILRFLGIDTSIAAPVKQIIYGLLLIFIILKKPQGIFGKYGIR